MSAALTLPNVWAADPATPHQRFTRTPLPATAGSVFVVALFRRHTEALLRRYMHLSMEMGRTPSALGKSMFRGRVSHYRVRSFEDAIIFVFDVEKCLKRLDPFSQVLLARIALHEYSRGEAAELTGQSTRTISRKYAESLDRLTGIFLQADLLGTTLPRSWSDSLE